jgi:hypothetical protein
MFSLFQYFCCASYFKNALKFVKHVQKHLLFRLGQKCTWGLIVKYLRLLAWDIYLHKPFNLSFTNALITDFQCEVCSNIFAVPVTLRMHLNLLSMSKNIYFSDLDKSALEDS